MDVNDVKDFFVDLFPYQRKSALDWIVPSAIGLGIGVAAGVGLGMILAPQPGAQTRQKLLEGANTLKDKAKTQAKSLAERARGGERGAESGLGSSYGDIGSTGVGGLGSLGR